tara:strand:- start:2186 stop:2416 length:231 start_codon:yes stop_codon:yes gene_type:complete
MSQINVTTTKNTVQIIDEINNVIEVSSTGPQGPAFGIELDHANKVDNSIMYYDLAANKVKLDATVTKTSIVNGGNF